MKMRWWTPGVVTVTLLLAACSTTRERPEPYTLPQYAEPDRQCRDISGSYNALPRPLGEPQRDSRPLLALTLLPAQESLAQATTVALAVADDGSLQVMAQGQEGRLLAKRRYAVDSGVFECDDGLLQFYPGKLAGGAPGGLTWETVVLRKTEDGSLMLRKGGLFSGLAFMVIPMYVSTEDWYLFKPASDEVR